MVSKRATQSTDFKKKMQVGLQRTESDQSFPRGWSTHIPEPEPQSYREVNMIKGPPHPFLDTAKSSPIRQILGREGRKMDDRELNFKLTRYVSNTKSLGIKSDLIHLLKSSSSPLSPSLLAGQKTLEINTHYQTLKRF